MSPPGRGAAPGREPGTGDNVIALYGPHRTDSHRTGGAVDLRDTYALLARLAPRIRLAAGDRLSWLMIDLDTGVVTWGGVREAGS